MTKIDIKEVIVWSSAFLIVGIASNLIARKIWDNHINARKIWDNHIKRLQEKRI